MSIEEPGLEQLPDPEGREEDLEKLEGSLHFLYLSHGSAVLVLWHDIVASLFWAGASYLEFFVFNYGIIVKIGFSILGLRAIARLVVSGIPGYVGSWLNIRNSRIRIRQQQAESCVAMEPEPRQKEPLFIVSNRGKRLAKRLLVALLVIGSFVGLAFTPFRSIDTWVGGITVYVSWCLALVRIEGFIFREPTPSTFEATHKLSHIFWILIIVHVPGFLLGVATAMFIEFKLFGK